MATRTVTKATLGKMYDMAGVPVASCAAFACVMAVYSGVRCYTMNPDVRRSRRSLHEPVPGEDAARAGSEWKKLHEQRHLRNEAGNVGVWNVLGMKRVDPVEEFYPGTLSRQ